MKTGAHPKLTLFSIYKSCFCDDIQSSQQKARLKQHCLTAVCTPPGTHRTQHLLEDSLLTKMMPAGKAEPDCLLAMAFFVHEDFRACRPRTLSPNQAIPTMLNRLRC